MRSDISEQELDLLRGCDRGAPAASFGMPACSAFEQFHRCRSNPVVARPGYPHFSLTGEAEQFNRPESCLDYLACHHRDSRCQCRHADLSTSPASPRWAGDGLLPGPSPAAPCTGRARGQFAPAGRKKSMNAFQNIAGWEERPVARAAPPAPCVTSGCAGRSVRRVRWRPGRCRIRPRHRRRTRCSSRC